jgi:hypothetical protein
MLKIIGLSDDLALAFFTAIIIAAQLKAKFPSLCMARSQYFMVVCNRFVGFT